MSFLPYATSGAGSWLGATGGSVIAHGLVIATTLGGMQQLLEMTRPAPEARLEYTVTLESLDSDTIVGLLDQGGETATDGGEGEQPAAEPATEEPERLAALTPQAETLTPVEEPEPKVLEEPDTLETMEPETPAATEPEALTGTELTPEDLASVEGTALDTAQPVATETLTAQPITPIAPLEAVPQTPIIDDSGPLIAESVTATAPAESISPLVADSTALASANPVPSTPQVARPVSSGATVISAAPRAAATAAEAQTAVTVGATPRPAAPSAPAPPPSAQDLKISDLLRRIRSTVHDPCLLALPRRDGEDGVGLALIGRSETAMTRFADAVMTAEDADIRQTRTLVDERQCAALSYIRENTDYPATRLGVRLDANEVPSGGRLTGVIRGMAGRYVLLLLVDNNGVAQDLQRFLSFSGNFARFDVPVTRQGPPRDTKQMLLAIAARSPVTRMRDRAGQMAQNMFAGLEGELASGAALAVATFDVR